MVIQPRLGSTATATVAFGWRPRVVVATVLPKRPLCLATVQAHTSACFACINVTVSDACACTRGELWPRLWNGYLSAQHNLYTSSRCQLYFRKHSIARQPLEITSSLIRYHGRHAKRSDYHGRRRRWNFALGPLSCEQWGSSRNRPCVPRSLAPKIALASF